MQDFGEGLLLMYDLIPEGCKQWNTSFWQFKNLHMALQGNSET